MKLLFAFLLMICFSVSAQQEPDSLLTVLARQKDSGKRCATLNDISNFYYQIDPKKGLEYANQALRLASTIRNQASIGRSHLNLGKHNMVLGKYDEALLELDKSRDIYSLLNDNCLLGQTYLFRGSVYGNLSKYPDALDALFEALRNFENCSISASQKRFMAAAFQNIANIYNATQNYEKALGNYDKAIAMWKEIPGEDISIAMNIASKGIVYEKLNRYSEAISVYLEAKKRLGNLSGSKVPLAFVNSWLGKTYLLKGEFEKSIGISNMALTVITGIGDRDLMASTIQNIGYAMLQKGKSDSNMALAQNGIAKLNQALVMHKELRNHEGLIDDYKYLAEYYKFKKQFDRALEAYELASIYKDSVFNFRNKQSLQNLEDKRSIELRDKQLQLNTLTIAAREKQNLLYVLCIAALLTIGSLIYWQSHNRKKTNAILSGLNSALDTANQTKARLFSIIGHDLRTPVSHIYQFLELQKNDPELFSEEDKIRHNARITSAAGNLLETMEDLLTWSKSQMQEFQVNPSTFSIDACFKDCISLTKNQFEAKNITRIEKFPADLFIKTDRNMLMVVLRNLLQNAINATPSDGEIVISAMNKKEFLFIEISNSGAMPEDARMALESSIVIGSGASGLGLTLVRELSYLMKAEISVVSSASRTTVQVRLPMLI